MDVYIKDLGLLCLFNLWEKVWKGISFGDIVDFIINLKF